jgi:hypothetical protein
MMQGETPDTQLTYRDLAEAIYQSTLPYFDQTIDPTYLRERIRLLREALSLDPEGYLVARGKALESRFEDFFAGKSLKPLDLFGISGFLEVPHDAPEVNAWNEMQAQYGSEIQDVLHITAALRRKWLLLYLESLLTEETQQQTIAIQSLLDQGLPASAPDWDPFDNY